MVAGARTSRKQKDGENISKSRNAGKSKDSSETPNANVSSTTKVTYSLRSSVRETPSKKRRLSSPLGARKSERIENRTLPTPLKRKSERVEKRRMQNLQSRSERDEKYYSLSSSSSKKSGKSSSSLGTKKKKVNQEKKGKQAAVRTGEQRKCHKQDQKFKQRLDARSYRASLKTMGKKVKQPELGKKQRKENSSQGDTTNEGIDGSKVVEGVANKCSGKKEEELRGKTSQKRGEKTVEGYSSASRERAEGILINDNGNKKSTRVNRKRKFCEAEAQTSESKDGMSLSKCSDSFLQSSSADIIANGTLDDAARLVADRLAGEDMPEPVKNGDNVSTKKDLVRPVKYGDKVSVRDDLPPNPREDMLEPVKDVDKVSVRKDSEQPVKYGDDISVRDDLPQTPERILSTAEPWPPSSDVILETHGKVGALKDGENVSIGEEFLPECTELCPPSSDIILERVETVGILKGVRDSPNQDPDLSAIASRGTYVRETSTAEAISSSASATHDSKLNNRCSDCFKRKRLGCGSQYQEVCSCNPTNNDLCDISLSKEIFEKIGPLRTPQKDKIVGSLFLEDKIDGKFDQDVMEQVIVSQKLSGFDLTDSLTPDEISVPQKEDRVIEVSDGIGIVEECSGRSQLNESSLDTQNDSDHNACAICKLGGKLLVCDGKGCRKSYHLSCLDPPLKDVPHGIWHCLPCLKKKIESGVHSVSEGVESVWNTREVEVLDHEGMRKEKQYLVKFRGLAHVHNRWIPESQLLHDSPVLIAKFNRRHQNGKIHGWKSEWTVPQRLVHKRLLMTPKQAESGTGTLNCRYEWLVKWNGLGYEHATWELENASFLSSHEALVKDYESRHEKAKQASDLSSAHKVLQKRKASLKELPKLPGGCPSGLEEDLLSFVNKLHDYWHKCHNAIVLDDQERIMKVILFIISLHSDVCRPFLIISNSTNVPIWEAELLRLAPFVNSVVYSGNKDVRKSIRELEFYDYESGHSMIQVLVSPPEAIVEDFEALQCLDWEAIIVDDCQNSRVSKHYEKISMLISNFRVLLTSGHIRDTIHEYQNLLSFLEAGDSVHANNLKNDSNDNTVALPALKERLARYIVYERKSDNSRFLEYWVPVWLSNVQLEKYCATLLSNSSSLYSCTKNDPVGALREMLISTRKCCDHPYLVDASLQSTLTKGHPEVEYLNIGVNASGKLKLLDKILQEIKKRGLRVLILFQPIGGSGRGSIGDILDDFLRQRFGPDSYERVDSGVIVSKKQAALNMFNSKERGRFTFLIENRACLPSIKLTAVDAVIIYDSDWNPLNDLRALQKISIDSQFEQLKVFRLYSPCTVEEKVLAFSKQDITLESNIQNISRSISHMLLIWGASHLFDRLDEFHGLTSPSSGSAISSEQSLLDDAVVEMLTQLPAPVVEANSTSNCTVIKRVQHRGTAYSRNISLLGEQKMLPTEEELPHVFWKKLLEGRYPPWRYLSAPSPRARKKVQYLDKLPKIQVVENDEARKKHKKGGSKPIDPISTNTCLEDKRKSVLSDEEAKMADATTFACSSGGSPLIFQKRTPIPCAPKKDPATEVPERSMMESEGRRKLRYAQKTLHRLLEPEIAKLCDALQLPDDVKHMALKFLEYIMNNHHVSSKPVTILQAFQISLCWIAASFLKHKVDHKESLKLAKKHLNFECKKEEAESVYSKLRMLKKRFRRQTGPTSNSSKSTSAEVLSSAHKNDDVARHVRTVEAIASELLDLEEGEIRENSPSHSLSIRVPKQGQIPECEGDDIGIKSHSDNVNPHCIDAKESQNPGFVDKCVKRIEQTFTQRTNQILLKQQEEIGKFIQFRENEKKKLKDEYRLESNLIFRTHRDPSVRSDMLKKLDAVFLTKKAEFDKRMVDCQRKIIAMQQAAKDREKRTKARWLEEARSGQLSESISKLPLPDTRFILENMESSERNRVGDDVGDTMLSSGPSLQLKNVDLAVSRGAKPTVSNAKSADTPASSFGEGVEGMPIGNATLTIKSSNRNGVGSKNDGMDNVALERLGETDTPARVHSVSSPQQFRIELPSLAHSHTSPGQLADTPERILREGTEGALVGDVSLTMHSREKTAVSSESDEMKNTASEMPSEADKSSCPCLVSSQQFQIDAPALAQPHTSPGHDNAQPPHQVPSTENSQPLASAGIGTESIPSCGGQSPHHTEVSLLHPVDVASSQVEQSNDNGSDSLSDAQLQLPPIDVPSVEHNQPVISFVGSQDEPSTARSGSQQAEVAMQQPPEAISSQVEQHYCSTSQSLTHFPMPVFMNIPSRVMPVAGLGGCTGMIQEPSNRPTQNLIALQSQLPCTNPLQNELNKIRREEEKTIKMHEDKKVQLKSECVREIEEVRRKYNCFIHDAETTFQQNLELIQTKISKVFKNLMLAEAFRLMVTDPTKSMAPALRQGMLFTSRYSSMQSLPQILHQPSSGEIAGPPIQRPPAPSLGNLAAPHMSPIIPTVNLHVGAQMRARAPHQQQPFRPSSTPSSSNQLPLIRMASQQQLQNSFVTTSPRYPQVPIYPPSSFGTRVGTDLPYDIDSQYGSNPHPSALPASHDPFLSALELPVDIDSQYGSNPLNLPPLTEPGLTFNSLVPSNLTMGMGPGGQGTTSPLTTGLSTMSDVISLSDDD